MRFFKSCRIVKRTRAREMLFRIVLVCDFTLARASSPWTSYPAGTCNPVDPGNPNAPQNEVAYEVVLDWFLRH